MFLQMRFFSKFLSSMISVIFTYLHILSFVFLTNPLTLIGRGSRAVISALNEARETLQRLKKSILKADDRLPKWWADSQPSFALWQRVGLEAHAINITDNGRGLRRHRSISQCQKGKERDGTMGLKCCILVVVLHSTTTSSSNKHGRSLAPERSIPEHYRGVD